MGVTIENACIGLVPYTGGWSMLPLKIQDALEEVSVRWRSMFGLLILIVLCRRVGIKLRLLLTDKADIICQTITSCRTNALPCRLHRSFPRFG
ncbi:hypothetical protein T4B_12638 [Trichinella pseudospiralis]|uniref:Uncharacterized protein n=2 Tax=Trichinella pseudospiralis TaxID=6337 RepID=A0A0V1JJE9_TRIPS|nr:hypothetical protein T4E_12375 [Trichinella pseudospiralis]KRY92693.1 hypothetical protein T4D_13913 [Trichinella pseudospiralis]KRZ35100.1 hypothetical protein T4B_12638 [Trichinella pseudospiralis]